MRGLLSGICSIPERNLKCLLVLRRQRIAGVDVMEDVCTYVGFFVVEGGSKGECLRDGCLEIEVLFAWYASLGGVVRL